MTNEQKAIKIAKFDGKLKDQLWYIEDDPIIQQITEEYLTNLNYLIPCYVKVCRLWGRNKMINLEDVIIEVVMKRFIKNKGKYQDLFNDLYSLIIIIENSAD